MVCQLLAPPHHTRGKILIPKAEGSHDKVVKTTHRTSNEQRLGLTAALGTRHQHLRGSRGLGEGVLAVHVLDKIFAERYQEQDAENAAERRSDKHFEEVGLQIEHINGRQHKDGTSHHRSRARADALDDDILAQGILALGGRRHTDGYNGDRDGGLEHLSYLEAKVGSGGRKQHHHEQAPCHTPNIHLRVLSARTHYRLVLLALMQLSKSVVGQLYRVFLFFFHTFSRLIVPAHASSHKRC